MRMRFIRCASWDGCKRFFALPAVLASEVYYTGENDQPKKDLLLIPRFILFLQNLECVFRGRCSFVEMSRTTVRPRGLLILLFLSAVTTPHHRCSVANMAWDRLVSAGRMLTILGFLARGANCTNVHLARLTAGVKRAGVDVHDTSLASGSNLLGYEVSPANSYCCGTGKRTARGHSVARTSHWRPGDGCFQWSRVPRRPALVVLSRSLTPASSSRRRPIWLQGNHGQLCAWSKERIWGEFLVP